MDIENFRKKLLKAFYIEYKEHLEGMYSLLDEASSFNDRLPEKDLNEALRRAHTLKGAARAVDITPVRDVAHKIESVFSKLVKEKGLLCLDVRMIIKRSLDAIDDYMQDVQNNREPHFRGEVLEEISGYLDDGDTLKSKKQVENGKGAGSSPRQKEAGKKVSTPPGDNVRIDSDTLNRLNRTAGKILIEDLKHGIISEKFSEIRELFTKLIKQTSYTTEHSSSLIRSMELDPAYRKIASFINLILHQSSLISKKMGVFEQFLGQHIAAGDMNNGELRNILHDLRMIPLENIVVGFRKMMRDLASGEGKNINFIIEGMKQKADKLILQNIKDPVIQLLRNAVSHGIESGDIRKKKGKPELGCVKLSFVIDKNRLVITVRDDGRGIDIGELKKRAAGDTDGGVGVEGLSDRQLLNRIFKPGVSTSSRVYELAGRGMGLSIVKNAVDRNRGRLSVSTEQNRFTEISMFVPVSCVMQKIVVVRAGNDTWGIPIENVSAVSIISTGDIKTVLGKPSVVFRDRNIHFSTLSYLLKSEKSVHFPVDSKLCCLIIKMNESLFAVSVDELISESDVVLKDLPEPVSEYNYLSGAFIRENGRICLVLNLNPFIEEQDLAENTIFSLDKQVEPVMKPEKPVILVVDDSITTRTLEKNILESRGYRVKVAVDGFAALSLLRLVKVDLVISDIRMPKMDGFTLLSEMKKDVRLKNIPVIVVTSMESTEDVERGLNLGAEAFIMKQKFDQKELLETVEQIL